MSVCWKCRTQYPPEVESCVRCGVQLKAAPLMEDPEPPPEQFSARERFFGRFPGLLRPGLMGVACFVTAAAFALFYYALIMLKMGVIFGAVGTGAVALVIYAQALTWVMMGEFLILHSALLDFNARDYPIFFALLFAPFLIFFLVLKYIVYPGM